MTSTSTLLRSLLIYSVCLPLAIFLGYLLATPLDYASFFGVGLVIFLLLLPLLLRWHHLWLITLWNTGAVLFFLPGRPYLWLLMAWMSLVIGFVQYILNRRQRFISVPSLARPLIFLAVVVLATAKLTGGIGLNALGSEVQGGKRYIMVFSAIAGYFAFCSRQLRPRQALLAASLFFLLPITNAIGDLAHFGGGPFNFLFLIFPVSHEGLAAIIGDPGADSAVTRYSQVEFASAAFFSYFLARYGIREVFTLRHPVRLCAFLLLCAVGTVGGFRSTVLTFLFTFGILFYLEGLLKSRLLPGFLLAGALVAVVLVGTIDRMPLSIQRSLAFLPLKIDPMARLSAETSSEWRVEMWKHVLPQVPHYLLLGKGYAFNMNDAAQVGLEGRRTGETYLGAEMAGDYHNGPLSLILPFGVFGVAGFIWLMIAGGKVLYQNYKFGDPAYVLINRFLFATFLCKVVFFFLVFGSLYSDLAQFVGLFGLSVTLNGGVAKQTVPATAPARRPLPEFRPRGRPLPAT